MKNNEEKDPKSLKCIIICNKQDLLNNYLQDSKIQDFINKKTKGKENNDFDYKYNINNIESLSLKKECIYESKSLDKNIDKTTKIELNSPLILGNDISFENNKNIINNNIYKNENKKKKQNNNKSKININITKKQNNKKSLIKRKRKPPNSNLLYQMKKECELCHKLFDSCSFSIHHNSHPTKILSWLYLGTFTNARNIEELKMNKINFILNVAVECKNKKLPENIKELHLKIEDSSDVKIIDYFEKANEFIDRCRIEGGNLLVHCKFGISRSPSFIIAYLIKFNKFSVDYALEFIKEKRNKINPNSGFLLQLYKYEEIVNKKQL